MPDFEIITLSPEDWRRYREIRLEALRTEPRAFATSYASACERPAESWQERLAEAQRGEKSWLFFAQAGDRLVGLVGAFVSEEAPSAEIVQVYVSPGWRGKGAATALMGSLLAAVAEAGIHTAVLTVNREQGSAVALYQKLGFIITGEVEAVLGDGMRYREYRMEIEI